MPAKKSLLLFAIATMIATPTGIASANELNIQTPNVQMSLDSNGGVNIRTPSPRKIKDTIRVYHPRFKKCRSNSFRRLRRIGRNRVYTSSVTRVCR